MATRILMVTPTFHPASGFGGPTVFTKALFDGLSAADGIDIEVLTTRWGISVPPIGTSGDLAESRSSEKIGFSGYRIFRDFSLELLARLPRAVGRADIVQIHSVFSPTSLAALLIARCRGKPVVLVPHGQMQAYGVSRRRFLKVPWLWLVKGICGSARMVVRAASSDELEKNFRVFPTNAHAMIANGVGVPARLGGKRSKGVRRLMFLGRLDPVKQPEVLLRALSLLPDDIVLDVHGSGDPAYESTLAALSVELGISERVLFHGWLGDADLAGAFASASVLVVPSRSESFGQVVVEALAHGVPVVASQGTPWQALDARDCGRWVPAREDAIAQACLEVLQMEPVALRRRARRWMREAFSPDAINARFKDLYGLLLNKELGTPASVRLIRRQAKICIVSSCGGHLAEVKALAAAYASLPHFFVLNDRIELPAEMIGRTTFIKHSERDAWFLWNLWEVFAILWRERPTIILSSGAGPIVPAALVGRYLFGCRVIYIETMTRMRVPSLTGRIMYRFAHRFLYQWPGLRAHFPNGIHAGPFE